MQEVISTLVVGAGGCLGAILRHGVSLAVQKPSGEFPRGTFAVNLLGCLVLGLIAAWPARAGFTSPPGLFFTAGLCGGFTTMSAFICETTHLARGSGFAQALGYLVATVAGCAAVFFAGFQAVRWILKI